MIDRYEQYLQIIKDEVNVKDIIFNPNQKEKVILDTVLTPELIKEGEERDQKHKEAMIRKEMGLKQR